MDQITIIIVVSVISCIIFISIMGTVVYRGMKKTVVIEEELSSENNILSPPIPPVPNPLPPQPSTTNPLPNPLPSTTNPWFPITPTPAPTPAPAPTPVVKKIWTEVDRGYQCGPNFVKNTATDFDDGHCGNDRYCSSYGWCG